MPVSRPASAMIVEDLSLQESKSGWSDMLPRRKNFERLDLEVLYMQAKSFHTSGEKSKLKQPSESSRASCVSLLGLPLARVARIDNPAHLQVCCSSSTQNLPQTQVRRGDPLENHDDPLRGPPKSRSIRPLASLRHDVDKLAGHSQQ